MTANTSGLCSLSCDVDSIQGHMVCYVIYLSVAWGVGGGGGGGGGGLACFECTTQIIPRPWWET